MTTVAPVTPAPTLHIGERCRFENLDWFPIWGGQPAGERSYRTNTRSQLNIEEGIDPDPSYLWAQSVHDDPLVLFEGSLFTAGYQHRALTRTVVLSPGKWVELPVVCVEKGRWDDEFASEDGDDDPGFAEVIDQVAPLRVRSAMRGTQRTQGAFADMFEMDEPQQQRVWQEVSRYSEATRLGNATDSLVSLETHYRRTFHADRLTPLPGQTGIIVAQGGYPVWMEVFDHPDTLTERFGMILDAYRLDSHGLEYQETPSRRARRFAHIVNQVPLVPHDSFKKAKRNRSVANPYVATEATRFKGTTIHLTSMNVQHPLLAS